MPLGGTVTLSTATVTTPISRGPLLGFAVQFVLLAVLSGMVGLNAAGWISGAAYAIGLCVALGLGLRRAAMAEMGPANVVTFGRAILAGGVTAMVATSWERPVSMPVLVTLIGVALALDGVDGQVARRTGSTSALGARFDMEVDAFLILVLSVYIAGTFGWWTVAIGAFRYVFVAASWALPWLNAALPPRFSRKVVAAVQGVVLVVATAGLLPQSWTLAAVIAALASLTWSFGRDVGWLARAERTLRWAAGPSRHRIAAPVPVAARTPAARPRRSSVARHRQPEPVA